MDFLYPTENINEILCYYRLETNNKMPHIFSTHGFKHFLQLNSKLLNVVDQDAWLRTER